MEEFIIEQPSKNIPKYIYRLKPKEEQKSATWIRKFSKSKSEIPESLPLPKFKEKAGWL